MPFRASPKFGLKKPTSTTLLLRMRYPKGQARQQPHPTLSFRNKPQREDMGRLGSLIPDLNEADTPKAQAAGRHYPHPFGQPTSAANPNIAVKRTEKPTERVCGVGAVSVPPRGETRLKRKLGALRRFRLLWAFMADLRGANTYNPNKTPSVRYSPFGISPTGREMGFRYGQGGRERPQGLRLFCSAAGRNAARAQAAARGRASVG